MLDSPTPFPYVGSYCLAELDGEHQLARILARRVTPDNEARALIGFPLRDGATGNREVAESELIDASPLTADEEREFHDLDRALFGRTQFRTDRQKRDKARRDALRRRIVFGPILDRLMRFLPAARRPRRAA
jgi:hypothetical protein